MIVIGSQAILGQHPDAPPEALRSVEADLIPVQHPERWGLIDGVIGEGSPFHETFGYYADGVEERTAVLPAGWKDRLVPVRTENTRGVTGHCLEVYDLLISRYVAGREKDLEFTAAVARGGLARREVLLTRLAETGLDARRAALVAGRIRRDFPAGETGPGGAGPWGDPSRRAPYSRSADPDFLVDVAGARERPREARLLVVDERERALAIVDVVRDNLPVPRVLAPA